MSSTHKEFNLDREISIDHNVDALGKKWEVHYNRGTSLCHIVRTDRSDAQIPEAMQGQWTKPSLLTDRLKAYLNESWDTADKASALVARTEQAEVEAPKKESFMEKLISN